GLLLRSREDESRPELSQTRNHLRGAMTKKTRRRGTSLAALVQSSEAKPLFRMGILLRLKAVGRGSIDVFRLHPWFGLFPAELEFVYPFTQAVTEKVERQRRTDLRGVLSALKQ